jgi:hypothetical protein
MIFHNQFLRVVAPTTGAPTLGSDVDPRTNYGTAGAAPPAYKAVTSGADNILMMRQFSKIAESYKRIVIGALGPAGATSVTASLYVFEEMTAHWYLLGTAKSGIVLTFGSFTSVTVPTIGEPPQQGTANQSQAQSAAQQPFARNPGVSLQGDSGGMAVMLCVDASGTPPAGEYQFTMAPSFADNVT